MAASLSELVLEFPDQYEKSFSTAAGGASILHQAAAMMVMFEDEGGQKIFGTEADKWAGWFFNDMNAVDAFSAQCVLSAYMKWCAASGRTGTSVQMIAESIIGKAISGGDMAKLLQEFEKDTLKPPSGTVEINKNQSPETTQYGEEEEEEENEDSRLEGIRETMEVVGKKLKKSLPSYEFMFARLPEGVVGQVSERGILFWGPGSQKFPSGAKKRATPAKPKAKSKQTNLAPKSLAPAFFFSFDTGQTSVLDQNTMPDPLWSHPLNDPESADNDVLEEWKDASDGFQDDIAWSVFNSFETLQADLRREIKKTEPGTEESAEVPPSNGPRPSAPAPVQASSAVDVKPESEMTELLASLKTGEWKVATLSAWIHDAIIPDPEDSLTGHEKLIQLRAFARLCVMLAFRVSKDEFIRELELAYENLTAMMLHYIQWVLGGDPVEAKGKRPIFDAIKLQNFFTNTVKLANPIPALTSGSPFDLEESNSDDEAPPLF
jgi:hypothetical protein